MAKKSFGELSEREILALPIQLEEEDSRVYGDFADGLREKYPATANSFDEMAAEESRHRQRLIEMYRQRFGDHILLVRRHDVKGLLERRPVWLVRPLGINAVRKQVEIMEAETLRFYQRALEKTADASTRALLGDLAEVERQHFRFAETLKQEQAASGARARGGSLEPPHVHAAGDPAGPGGTDGWVQSRRWRRSLRPPLPPIRAGTRS